MNRLLTILLLLGATAHGQINNPPTSVNIVDSTATGRAVLTATNAAAGRSAIGAGTVNEGGEPSFESVTADLFTAEAINEATGGLQALDLLNFSLTFGTNYVLEWSATDVQLNKPLTFFGTNTASTTRTNLGLGGTNTATFGNVVLNADGNLAPAQTADSGDSLMTRGLTDARYFPLASFWLPAGEMETFNGSGTGFATWAEVAPIANMVTPFGRAPKLVSAVTNAVTEGIYPIPIGWPAGAAVRVTTYLAMSPGQSTTNTFVLRMGRVSTTNASIITPVATAIAAVFGAQALTATNVTGTGTNGEYFKIDTTVTFPTNVNPQNRMIFLGRSGTSTNDTATNVIHFIGSHVELLP